ncbi:chemokine-like factor isoform X1 [Oenanthe melanoleuca]|uniref:chemokine-like factor isoform X1 n=1 Tax=Oenanthe melanoleuca TaxID=2939378 RepID=UPI0024C0E99F|nr:chemokine-like factor isoform X1 [Oenanthe melanoleuca]
MAPASPASSAPGSPRLPGPSRAAASRQGRQGRVGSMVWLKVDWAFLRSPRGSLKLSRTLVALAALICFMASGSHEAYAALAGMETGITVLFLLIYLLRVDTQIRCFYWPLADVLNSMIAALFLLVVSLFALIKTNKGTLAGGVLGLVLLVLCLVDVILLYKKISLDKARGRSAPAK